MIINHNISALNTYRSLTINHENTARSIAKLSSGLRINTAGDDAAGLAISEKMRSQIRGLDQATRNAYDGKSLLNVAEGALNETHAILQRMKELSVQSANDTNTEFDRGEIQKEVEQLKTEIDRISRDTEFNTMKLLNGTMASTATNTSAVYNTTTGNITSSVFGIKGIEIQAKGTDSSGNDLAGKGLSVYGKEFDIVGIGVQKGVYTLTAVTAIDGNADVATVKASGLVGNTAAAVQSQITLLTGAQFGEYRLDYAKNLGGTYDLTLTGPDGRYQIISARDKATAITFDQLGVKFDFSGNNIAGEGSISFKNQQAISLQLQGPEQMVVNYAVTYSGGDINMGGIQFQLRVNDAGAGDSANLDVVDKSIKLHVGANQGQNMGISILDSSSKALGVNTVDLRGQKTSDIAITVVDKAINRVSSERSKMGAIMNRLDHTIKNLGTTAENLTASESRIRDVDMAKEVMEFTKGQILSQASQSMLAQANMIPQGVLSLLQ